MTTSSPIAASSAQPPQTQQPPQSPPESTARVIFTGIKEKVTWAWDTTILNLKTATDTVKQFVQRIIASVCTFFASKIESTQQTYTSMLDNISLKLGARHYGPQIAALQSQLEQMRQQAGPAAQPPAPPSVAPQPEVQPPPPRGVFPWTNIFQRA